MYVYLVNYRRTLTRLVKLVNASNLSLQRSSSTLKRTNRSWNSSIKELYMYFSYRGGQQYVHVHTYTCTSSYKPVMENSHPPH